MLNLKNKSFSSLVKPSILILISGIFIRLVTALWPQSLSSDEQVSLHFAQINLVESFLRDNSAPLFSLLLRIWQNLVPISESALRLLPFLISTLTLIYVWKRWNEFWVRFLFVINPASISFAGDLKNTALFELFTVIFISESLHLFKLFKDHKRIEPRRYAIIFLVSLGLIFSHYLGLLLIFSGLLGLVLWKPIATQLRLKIIFFVIFSGLLMFGINYYWLHPESLVWMQNFHKEDGSLLFLLPPYVLGSYSRTWAIFLFGLILWNAVKKKSIESIWCVG
ncbi:MAG: hypothetical protein H7235_02180, partial [Bdellovibrionaceae bacterium]|nr:hypothetical protein [Pseudobdellovibrionaceae bacterium]